MATTSNQAPQPGRKRPRRQRSTAATVAVTIGKVVGTLLLIGIILRWDNIRQKAGIWFRYDDIMEQRADSLRQSTGPAPDSLPAADSLPVPARR